MPTIKDAIAIAMPRVASTPGEVRRKCVTRNRVARLASLFSSLSLKSSHII